MNPTTQHVAQQAYIELPHFRSPQIFPPIALAAFNMAAMRIHENPLHTPQPTTTPDIDIEHFCAPVIHPVTGEHITTYKKLQNDPLLMERWEIAFGKEFGGLAQGDDITGEKGINTIFVMTHEDIARIP